jgi:hypothetical protein
MYPGRVDLTREIRSRMENLLEMLRPAR